MFPFHDHTAKKSTVFLYGVVFLLLDRRIVKAGKRRKQNDFIRLKTITIESAYSQLNLITFLWSDFFLTFILSRKGYSFIWKLPPISLLTCKITQKRLHKCLPKTQMLTKRHQIWNFFINWVVLTSGKIIEVWVKCI